MHMSASEQLLQAPFLFTADLGTLLYSKHLCENKINHALELVVSESLDDPIICAYLQLTLWMPLMTWLNNYINTQYSSYWGVALLPSYFYVY